MEIKEFIRKEFNGWGKYERVIFPAILIFIIILSFVMHDNKIALISAICGIGYTILAGKGKISCYFVGLIGTFCYSYISYRNAFWGNLALYLLYCMPMQIIGIFRWRSHLDKEKQEIYKTCLSSKKRIIYFLSAMLAVICLYFVLLSLNDANPVFDSITSIFSILGLLLTVKRCMEQWYVWFVVNGFSAIMWIGAYMNGSNCLATVLMWMTYFFLGIYFLYQWRKEIKSNS
ncbi:nicotinamide mononucleotide transporter [bacterium]|nr:nicotinamide mononucleotide transporter [bacterium]